MEYGRKSYWNIYFYFWAKWIMFGSKWDPFVSKTEGERDDPPIILLFCIHDAMLLLKSSVQVHHFIVRTISIVFWIKWNYVLLWNIKTKYEYKYKQYLFVSMIQVGSWLKVVSIIIFHSIWKEMEIYSPESRAPIQVR